MPAVAPFADLLVGTETGDDAAVWRLADHQAVVATTDFFNPIVDDPHEFGRIAATNALSDIYAMGARPILALAILGFPRTRLPAAVDTPEPIYGLAVVGLVHPDRIATNRGAQAGDALVLTKPLGIGLYGAALRQHKLTPDQHGAMIRSTTQLNRFGIAAAQAAGTHAMTDCTGFGLLGHALEMSDAAGLALGVSRAAIPFLPGARALAEAGTATGASARNWSSYGAAVRHATPLDQVLLTDPQTSGGLLIAVAPLEADTLLQAARADGLGAAAFIGRFEPGRGLVVTA